MGLRPEKKSFDGTWVKLEPLNKEIHAAALFHALGSADDQNEIFTFMPYGPFANSAEFTEWVEKQANLSDRNVYCVFSKRLNKYVGICSLLNIDEKNGRAELGGIWYVKEAQRSEVNTEACYILLKYLFEKLRYRRIEWKCDDKNIRSRNAAIRLGFQYEGLFRKHMIVKGKNRDTAWFAIIDDDWQDVKERFRRNLLKAFGG